MNMYRQENFSNFTSRKKNKNYSGQIDITHKENIVRGGEWNFTSLRVKIIKYLES